MGIKTEVAEILRRTAQSETGIVTKGAVDAREMQNVKDAILLLAETKDMTEANEALQFAEWLRRNAWNGCYIKWYKLTGQWATTEELYALWQESKSK